MADNHVLRIPDQRSYAADVGAGRKRNEVRQQRQLAAPDDCHDERCEHQTNRIVNQYCGEKSRSEGDIEQKTRWRS
jgi:hypothetical protein